MEFHQQGERDGRGEQKDEKMVEKDSLVPKIPPPTAQASAGRKSPLALGQVDFYSFQPIRDPAKVMTLKPNPPNNKEEAVSSLTVPSPEVSAFFPENSERERMLADSQWLPSNGQSQCVNVGSEFTRSSSKFTE